MLKGLLAGSVFALLIIGSTIYLMTSADRAYAKCMERHTSDQCTQVKF